MSMRMVMRSVKRYKFGDDDEEDWYAAIIQKIDGDQYRVHYIGEDDFYDEWVDLDEMN